MNGILTAPRDSEDLPMPNTLVEILKTSMQSLYEEMHPDELDAVGIPLWKVLEKEKAVRALLGEEMNDSDDEDEFSTLFQRKILPFDLLDLKSTELAKNSRSNAAGNVKQVTSELQAKRTAIEVAIEVASEEASEASSKRRRAINGVLCLVVALILVLSELTLSF